MPLFDFDLTFSFQSSCIYIYILYPSMKAFYQAVRSRVAEQESIIGLLGGQPAAILSRGTLSETSISSRRGGAKGLAYLIGNG